VAPHASDQMVESTSQRWFLVDDNFTGIFQIEMESKTDLLYLTCGVQGQELLIEKDSELSLRGEGSGSGLSLRGVGSGSGLSLRGEGRGSGLTLHIAASGRHHAGVYTCQADNGWGHLANATVSNQLLIF
jgi:hypothetical protein